MKYLYGSITLLCLLWLSSCRSTQVMPSPVPADQTEGYELYGLWATEPIFQTPVAVHYDSRRSFIYLSNLGDAGEGQGFLSRLDQDGAVIELLWITGLNEPRGIARYGDRLYVAERTAVAVIDLWEEEIEARLPVPGARQLSDVTVDDRGYILAMDTGARQVYRIDQSGDVTPLLSGNGPVLWANQRLLVGDTDARQFSAYNNDGSITYGRVGRVESAATGLAAAGPWGHYLVSAREEGLSLIEPDGNRHTLLDTRDLGIAIADLGYRADRRIVLLPIPDDGRLLAYGLQFPRAAEWDALFNETDFTGWTKYLGIPHPESEVPGRLRNNRGFYVRPLGINNDPLNVFTVVWEDEAPAIRVTGEVFGTLIAEPRYENYHVQLQFKWGDKKWPPRELLPRDAGLLYHAFGDPGSVDGYWLPSQECQIQHGDTGDYWPVGPVTMEIPVVESDTARWYRYEAGAPRRTFFFSEDMLERRVLKSSDQERPLGQWNTVEVICRGDSSIHIVNGEVVMRLYKSRTTAGVDPRPLTRGQIALQSEGAEIFYRRIFVRPISEVPAKYRK